MPSPNSDTEKHRTHLYGRRKGKRLRASLRDALDHDLPQVRIDPEKIAPPCNPKAFFSPDIEKIWLEIGFGGGEHLAAQAQANPHVGFIGAEIFENGIASLLKQRANAGLKNIRILDNDARAFLPFLADNCLDRVFLLYPDPWPKAKHAKRRFVNQSTLDQLARLMTPSAELRIATDHPEYARWCLRHAPIHPAFQWNVSGPESWKCRPQDAIATRYEKKAIREGRTPMYLTFLRVAG
ncbi:MAG: tRNA (guanosine(46)-N7)-methyltransferase TrmB [Alphaproteobacteria bacterium]|nr:tRNA (guanosine(46)-N7)-methyltransferase TrmB [Alphaproteobacteria bacterium]